MRHPAGETVTGARLGAPTGAYDEQGEPVLGAPTAFTITDVAVAPAVTTESPQAMGLWVVTGYTLYCPPGTSLRPTDVLTIRGVDGWQVDGDSMVADYRNPFDGRARGVVVSVRRAV